jgi:hypothetical protein
MHNVLQIIVSISLWRSSVRYLLGKLENASTFLSAIGGALCCRVTEGREKEKENALYGSDL